MYTIATLLVAMIPLPSHNKVILLSSTIAMQSLHLPDILFKEILFAAVLY